MKLYDMICKDQPDYSSGFAGAEKGDAAKDLINRLLRKRALDRVGIPEVRTSLLYDGFNWDAFHARRMAPPFVPPKNKLIPDPR